MYGFHKVGHEDGVVSFSHPRFRRGAKDLLATIRRKIPKKESNAEAGEPLQEQLQKSVDTFSVRLAQLEQKDRDCEWLKGECQKLQ